MKALFRKSLQFLYTYIFNILQNFCTEFFVDPDYIIQDGRYKRKGAIWPDPGGGPGPCMKT